MPPPLPELRAPKRLDRRSALAAAAYLTLITALARGSGHDLLLFPELAALTTVVISTPDHPWARSAPLLVLTPLLSGTVGISISQMLPYGPLAVGLVVAISLLLIRVLHSAVIPALSAGLLPLALGVHNWSYPLALLPGTLGLALLIQLRRRQGSGGWPWRRTSGLQAPQPLVEARHAPAVMQPVLLASEPFPPLRFWIGPLVLFLAGSLVLVRLLGSPLVLYPPLLVLAWETLARPEHCHWRGRLAAVLAATGLAALIGLVLVRWLGPVPLATLLVVLLVSLLLERLRLICPPVFAVALLPFVVEHPADDFPVHVLAGSTWLVVVSALAAAHHHRRRGREWDQ